MQIKGLNQLMRELDRFEKDTELITKRTIEEVVDMMIRDAKAKAPRDLGRLIDSIDRENKDNGWTIVFFVGEVYGAFQEFGTLGRVQVPTELVDVASEFKGYKSGDFDEFLKSIKEWCSRKGIDEKASYPIAVSILRKGLDPQPYFYPAYVNNKDKIIPLIEQKVTQWLTRINR